MLPPWAIALLAVCCFVPGWAANRLAWFKVAFNIGNYLVAGLAAHAVVSAADVFSGGAAPEPAAVAALAVAAVVFTFLNHLLIVFVATFASGSPLRSALHQLADGLPLDLPLATTGACLAVLWDAGPAVALLALGPIALVYRALLVPQLEHRARTDPKTGLYNFTHFSDEMEARLQDARRQAGTLAVVVIDLDHLREINNRFGHLVGDRVILGVAEALASTGEPNATAARFGGEEFCLLLPGASLEEATLCAETVRERVASMRFRETDRLDDAATRDPLCGCRLVPRARRHGGSTHQGRGSRGVRGQGRRPQQGACGAVGGGAGGARAERCWHHRPAGPRVARATRRGA